MPGQSYSRPAPGPSGILFQYVGTIRHAALHRHFRRNEKTRYLPSGHEPDAVSLAEASSRGLQSIEHLPFLSLERASDAARIATFETFAHNGTWIDPTLVAMIGYRGTPDEEILKIIADKSNAFDSRRRYVSPKLLEFWRAQMLVKQVESPMDWSVLIKQ
jgi:hypothetical protein